MKINNPRELVGKEVCDFNGTTIGTVDKYWNYKGFKPLAFLIYFYSIN